LAERLAWAERRCRDFQARRRYVDGQLEAAQDGSDRKALWPPAKGQTETLVPTRPRAPLCKRHSTDSALHRRRGFGIRIPCGVAVRSGIARKGWDMRAIRRRWGLAAAAVLALVMDVVRPGAPAASRPATRAADEVLRIVFFHSLTCNECQKVERMLGRILGPWGGRARVEWRSTGDIQVFRELLLYDEHYGVRTRSPPVMFVGRRHLEGEKRIYRDLARVVREELAAGAAAERGLQGTPECPRGTNSPNRV
jgi:hypothetical protein